ncbi:hypothetical protein Enr10x_31610 [Gimesia panareensis]|uniref:DUF4064 domain-containing protein n=1 Tax=Gimesia panareensis TaxID=2527978 RepID=A0A517Q874_9PLAN|nr:hypothetical protein [Gimesia panareensis]QDT27827.1 hypothetical protein Enr10x_31610 [Gimesia panareensis]
MSTPTAKRYKQLKMVAWLIIVLGGITLVVFPLVASHLSGFDFESDVTSPPDTPRDLANRISAEHFTKVVFYYLLRLMYIWAWFYPLFCLLVGTLILYRRFYTLSVLGAALVCLGAFPLGAVIGGWALFVLCNRDTKFLFQEQSELREADFLD